MSIIYKRLFNINNIIYVIIDLLITFGAVLLSFFSYYGANDFVANIVSSLIYSGSIAVATVLFFTLFGIYQIITSTVGIVETIRIIIVALIPQTIGLIVLAFVPQLPKIEGYISIWILLTVSLILSLASIRFIYRISRLHLLPDSKSLDKKTIVIGAGEMGKVIIDETRRNKNNHAKVVAVIDDDSSKIGRMFANLPVYGPIKDISTVIEKYNAEEVIVAISDIDEERLHEIYEVLNDLPVRIRRAPTLSEMQGPNDKRIIDVNLDDLLCRKRVNLNNGEIKTQLNKKVVMVTGAGGSIGSELVKQIFKTHPKTLILFDIYENSTYDIQMTLNKYIRDENIKDIELVTLIGSTYNAFRVESIIKKYRPDYIYHAAAYKHVPLMEDSPMEAIRTNVIGTYNVASLADKYGVQKMILVSTDKAVRPTNVMGATKRFAEMIIQYFSSKSKKTKYAAVRFGNVLGSNGSVVPLFKKQIEAGGPITITDKRIIRYFMEIPEAVSLILQCGLFADGGEIFILDMGKPVKIINLAERLIRQAGLIPYQDIKIIETGLRPGEKLYEELLLDKSQQNKTKNSRIYIEKRDDIDNIKDKIKEISKTFEMDKNDDIKLLLSSIVDSYKITEN